MSVMPHEDPECTRLDEATIELDIEARTRKLGDGFTVRRLLPSTARRMVGPFIYFDHMGPVTLDPGHGLDVLPHPHINLATVTYLFRGELLHRDSLGTEQVIRPGAVNWMTAGRGIVHSERTPPSARKTGAHVHGLQLWVALPKAHEETEPRFQHVAAADIPELTVEGARLRVVAGSAFGETSPVRGLSPLFYVEARLERGGELQVPVEHAERAAYVVEGAVRSGGERFGSGAMIVFRRGTEARVEALEPSSVMLLGGDALDGERHVWWNFVASTRERIEQAQRDWQERRFPVLVGDDEEFIPLPPQVGRIR